MLVPFTMLLLMLPLSLMRNSHESSSPVLSSVSNLNITETEKRCDIFSGKWIPHPEGPYYNNETCNLIIDQQNCIKFGRPDRDYLHWRWKPEECELPLFDANQFLNLVSGKKIAFVGDSVGRNQMRSLLCLLNHVSDHSLLCFFWHIKRKETISFYHMHVRYKTNNDMFESVSIFSQQILAHNQFLHP